MKSKRNQKKKVNAASNANVCQHFFFSFCPAVKPQLSLYNDVNPYNTG